MISKILLFLCVFTTTLQAEVVMRQKEAAGVGETRGDAIAFALESAVGKAFGFRLEGTLQRTINASTRDTLDESKEELIAMMSREITRKVGTSSNTPITGYDILSAQENSQGWEAQVRIYYQDYKKLGAKDSRRTLVVSALDQRSNAFAEALESALIASRRFNILKRGDDDIFNAEKAFITSDDANRDDVARLGRALGADYIVLVKTERYFSRLNKERLIEATGERLYRSEAGFTFDIEVVEFSSRKVKWRNRDDVYVAVKRKVSNATNLLSGHTKRYAKNLALSLVSTIYPARIAQIIGNKAVLNRGEGSISIGQKVDIFLIGEKIVDPQSGESLGAMEVEVANAKVIELKPKFSVLQLTTGALTNGADYIVRWNTKVPGSVKKTRKKNKVASSRKKAKLEVKALDDTFLN